MSQRWTTSAGVSATVAPSLASASHCKRGKKGGLLLPDTENTTFEKWQTGIKDSAAKIHPGAMARLENRQTDRHQGLALALDLFHTQTLRPPFSRFLAIASPMIPRPRKP
jgi:hypothetical protein